MTVINQNYAPEVQARINRLMRIPQEMRDLPNWCVAGPNKDPYYYNEKEGFRAAKVSDPATWMGFDAAVDLMVRSKALGVGFMLHERDGYTCIDLDVKNQESHPDEPELWTTPEQAERYYKIAQKFDSYTELSSGGYGAHIWVKGYIGIGAKRDGVEVYSQERFLVCTGSVYNDKPIEERQELLDILITEIRASQVTQRGALEELEPEISDAEVYERAATAGNAEKFLQLMNGQWMGTWPSQSEADLALMSMLAFYSRSNEQCRRMFRASGLGQREKATKNDRHLNYCLEVIRTRQERERTMDAHSEAMARELVAKLQNGSDYKDVAAAQLMISQTESQETADAAEQDFNLDDIEAVKPVDWPPGMVGHIARFVYNAAPRPVKEVAIITTLGFMAGVCGKAFNLATGTGLNLYLILIARSGVGKETLHSGTSALCAALREANPAAQAFVDFSEFASGQALIKACARNNSFVNVSGEWGRRLQQMSSNDRGDGPMNTLRTQMTHLYQKSGQGNLVGGITYSNEENNIGMTAGVAYSLVGETTPETFYRSLTHSMMEDGFMSRFVLMEHRGMRPPANRNRVKEMDQTLRQALAALCAQAMANNARSHAEIVNSTPEADEVLDAFDTLCDNKINSTTDEAIRQMWNRAHLKVLRIAGILAAADNWIKPVIQKVHAEWALHVVMQDINTMTERLASGDVGQGDDHTRLLKAMSVIKEYFFTDKDLASSYGIKKEMKDHGVIPHRYLQIRCTQLSQFRTARIGAKIALDNTIKALIDNGYIVEAPKDKLHEQYGYAGRAYRIISYPRELS